MKPKKEFFEGFMKKTGEIDKRKMLIIGDELDKDIKGGNDNKIDSCWFHRKEDTKEGIKENIEKYKPNYEIKNLIDLKYIL